MEVLLGILRRKGWADRFELHELSPRCEGDFNRRFEAFRDRIASLPPCEQDEVGGA